MDEFTLAALVILSVLLLEVSYLNWTEDGSSRMPALRYIIETREVPF
jgi:hypothetical protein